MKIVYKLIFAIFFLNLNLYADTFENNSSIISKTIEVQQSDDFGEFDDEFGDEQDGDKFVVYDPLESYNRAMTNFNDSFYENILFPISDMYSKITPRWTRRCISNFYDNLNYPISAVNNLLQFKFKNFFTETMRFLVNSTFGVLGFFDIAKDEFDLDPNVEDFGQTFGYYGAGGGFHFVIPFLGQSNFRDFIGRGIGIIADPTWYFNVDFMDDFANTAAIKGLGYINYSSFVSKEYRSLKRNSVDFYIMQRDIYEQMREKEIKE